MVDEKETIGVPSTGLDDQPEDEKKKKDAPPKKMYFVTNELYLNLPKGNKFVKCPVDEEFWSIYEDDLDLE